MDLWGSLWITLRNVKNGIFVYVLFYEQILFLPWTFCPRSPTKALESCAGHYSRTN